MSQSIASFFTTIGFKVNESGLKQLQDTLNGIKKQVQSIGKINILSTAQKQNVERSIGPNKEQKDLAKFQSAVSAERLRDFRRKLNEEIALVKEATKTKKAIESQAERDRRTEATRSFQRSMAEMRQRTAESIKNGRIEIDNIKTQNRLKIMEQREKMGVKGPNLPRLFAGVTTEVGAGLAGFFGLTEFTRSLYNTQNLLFKLKTGLTAVTGSEKAAKAETDFLLKAVDDLSLNMQSAVQGFLSLSGSAKGSKISQQQVRDLFVATSKAVSVFGLSADDAQGAFRALGQMMSKQKISAEELRLQLGERLYGAVALAAEAMKKTVPELLAMMQAGQLLADDFIPKFTVQLEKMANEGNAFANSLKSPQAQMNRLSTAWMKFQDAVGSSGLYAAMGAVIEGLTEAIVAMTPAFKTTILLLREWGDILAFLITPMIGFKVALMAIDFWLAATKVNLMATMAPFLLIGAAAAALYLIVDDLVTALRGGNSVIREFANRKFGEDWAENVGIFVSKALLGFGQVLGVVAKIGAAIALWATDDKGKELHEFVGEMFDERGAEKFWDNFFNAMHGMLESIGIWLDELLFKPILRFFDNLVNRVVSLKDNTISGVTNFFKGLLPFSSTPSAPEAAKAITSPNTYGKQGYGPLAPTTTVTGGIQMNVTVPQGTTTDQAKSITEQFYDLISRESVSYPLQAAN